MRIKAAGAGGEPVPVVPRPMMEAVQKIAGKSLIE
jgi:hypothetical protein